MNYLFVAIGLILWFYGVNVCPQVLQYDDITVVTSGFRSQLFCLWFAGRRIVIDPTRSTVTLHYRKFWCLKSSRRIEFDWVQQVNFGGSFLWCVDSVRNPWSDRNSFLDAYTVQLQLKSGEVVTLYRYIGDAMSEGSPLMLVDILTKTIGVPLGAPEP